MENYTPVPNPSPSPAEQFAQRRPLMLLIILALVGLALTALL